MNIDYLIQLLNNRLAGLALAKDQAFQAGDLDRINALDVEAHGVQDTLAKLHLLAGIAQTAAATPFTEAEVVKNGIEASFNFANLTDATKCLSLYDITPYATDPYHEQKIQTILEKIPFFDSAESIEAYVKKAAPDSPLTGEMFFSSAQSYAVDVRLMVALIELDSRFGTAGVAITTLNPGNVGNTGTETRNYPSWSEGTAAVAEWLSRHRITQPVVVETPPVETPEPVATPEPVVETPAPTETTAPVEEPSSTVTPPVPEPVVEAAPVVSEPEAPTAVTPEPEVVVPTPEPASVDSSAPIVRATKRISKRKFS